MPGQTGLTRYMDAIEAIAKAFSWNGTDGQPYFGGAGVLTVKKGRTRYQDADNWQATIRSLVAVPPTAPPPVNTPVQGYFSFWIDDFVFEELELHPSKIVGELAVYVPKDVTTDMEAAYDLVNNFVGNGIGIQANYDVGSIGYGAAGNRVLIRPGPIKWRYLLSDDTESGGITFFDFGAHGSGGIEIPDP